MSVVAVRSVPRWMLWLGRAGRAPIRAEHHNL